MVTLISVEYSAISIAPLFGEFIFGTFGEEFISVEEDLVKLMDFQTNLVI